MARNPPESSPASLALAERKRIAAEEGARAIADVQREAQAIRKNMERLRALREARDVEAAANAAPAARLAKRTPRAKRVAKLS
ncbi:MULTISPECIES: hypothetical protein [unclassified Bradyrhizobium]